MREADLPSPNIGARGHALRRASSQAISQVQVAAAYYAGGKHPDAAALRAFFDGCAAAAASLMTSSAYLGVVATRLNIPSLANTSYKQIGSRRWFIARDDISELQLQFPNWFANNAVNEAGSGGTATFRASIEYPAGTFKQVKWSGNAVSPTVADGDSTPLSDKTAVVIPKGAVFWVRVFGEFSNAVVLNSLSKSAWQPGGDNIEYAASGLTDKTLGGTIPNGFNGVTFGPTLIVAATKAVSFLILGDSRNKGGATDPGTDTADATGDIGETARSVGASFAYVNAGTASETQQAFRGNCTRRRALANYVSHVINNGSINDFIAGRTAAQLRGDVEAVAAMFPDKVYVHSTIGPSSTSSDWTTVEGQTPFSNESSRVGFNTDLRNGTVAGVDVMVDFADAIESSRNSGKWAVGAGGVALTNDGLHANQAGAIRIRDSGKFVASNFTR